MKDSEFNDQLLGYLRLVTGKPRIGYADRPSRLEGGYDTDVFRFAVHGLPPLVLRMYRTENDASRAIAEGTVQNVLATQGYPTPRVHHMCTDPNVLGRPFIIMDYIEGRSLLEAGEPLASRLMGEVHAELHDIDTAPIIRALGDQGMLAERTLAGRLEAMAAHRARFPAIAPAIDWLIESRPDESTLSICHGDFHKLNVLAKDDSVAAVIDWSGATVQEAAFDVASTDISFSIVARHLMDTGDFDVVDLDEVLYDYHSAYEARRTLDRSHFDYYRVQRATMILVITSLGFGGFRLRTLLDDLASLINEISGCNVTADDTGVI
ncbi:MAG: phosphotransferase family protein [Pseudomonadales bacterium]|nr:phosphotransferase family protein [Pseudomonadales bacterium]